MNGPTVVVGILVTAWSIVVGIPMAFAFVLSGRAAREEERILHAELLRKAPPVKPTPRTRPYIRETHVLDYSTMTREDVLRAFDHEASTQN